MDYAVLYGNIWLWSTFLFCFLQYIKWGNSNGNILLYSSSEKSSSVFIYAFIFATWIGLRPMIWPSSWADSYNYRRMYLNYDLFSGTGDWLFESFQTLFASSGFSVSIWFWFLAVLYIGFMYLCIKRLFPYNQWLGLLFCFSAFSFFANTYNGIRNGIACSIVLAMYGYIVEKQRRNYFIAAILAFIAIGFHKSAVLPILCLLVSLCYKKNLKWSLMFWILSIFLSISVGSSISNFFANLGFDDRLSDYVGTNVADSEYAGMFSHTGFRWDFLLYSVMPIYLAYIVLIKKKIYDEAYIILINTYILANSFWIMVIQSLNSNRFAYLSWFMYPIVLAYPLLKVKIWNNQDKYVVRILMLHIGFTVFMNVIYY